MSVCARAHVATCRGGSVAQFRWEKQQPLNVNTCVFPAGGRLILQAEYCVKPYRGDTFPTFVLVLDKTTKQLNDGPDVDGRTQR